MYLEPRILWPPERRHTGQAWIGRSSLHMFVSIDYTRTINQFLTNIEVASGNYSK